MSSKKSLALTRHEPVLFNVGVLGDTNIKTLWLIELRWIVIFFGAFGYLLQKRFDVQWIFINPQTILEVGITLFIANTIFHLINITVRRFNKNNKNISDKACHICRIIFFLQVIVDYFCTSLLIWDNGIGHLNLLTLFLPHIVITAVAFEKKRVSFFFMWCSLILTYLLLYKIYQSGSQSLSPNIGLSYFIFQALLFTGLNHFIFYLTSMLSKTIIHQKNILANKNRDLIKVNSEKQNYTLRATHELKSPFTAIQSYVQVILNGYAGEVNPKITDILRKIEVRCTSLSLMIKNIIQLSHLKTMQIEGVDFTDVAIVQCFEEAIDSFQPSAKAKNIRLNLDTEVSNTFTINAEPKLLLVMINNLISNSIRYSLNNSQVIISLDKVDQQLRFKVIDFGIGISKENHGKIFTEHFRCNNAVRQDNTGNGMGLAIVQEIIKIHNASIYVESDLGKGTTFIVQCQ